MSEIDSEHGTPKGRISPQDRQAFEERSADLGRRLESVRTRREPPLDNSARGQAMAQGFKIAVELVVGVVFGGFLGWGLDRYFKTSGPWFLIVFVMLGFAAGMLNVIRTAQRMQAAAESEQKSAPSVKDDEFDD